MLPSWKIRRELIRIFGHLFSLPVRLFSFLFGRVYYDIALKKRAKIHTGKQALSNRACIYAIYPASDDCATQLLAVESIHRDRFSLVVVSNKEVTAAVREQILDRCAFLIERINFGYDFGAYRDGVLLLDELGMLEDLEHLWLLNDSCWYPIADRSWVTLALQKQADFVGATAKFSLPVRAVDRRAGSEASQLERTRNFHYASYSLLISRKLLRDRAFARFFRKLAISNDKRYTVRRGEIGLTQFVLGAGYSHCETHETSGLEKTLARLSDAELMGLINDLTTLNGNRLLAEKEGILGRPERASFACPPDRLFAEEFVLRSVLRQGLCYTLPVWLIESNRFPFLKKSLRLMNPDNQQIIHSYARARLPEASSIRREILQ